ncbi:non-ribosomal peptide synthetase, partial [Paenibacillus oenotherae]|nr:non-ribosomal peptide synthetase [Paenibacillus oenotherae]
EIQSSMDINQGPLVKLGLFKTRNGDHLLIAIHHLVVDGVSWRILLEDIAVAYGQASSGQPIVLPLKTDSFKRWSERLVDFANDPDMEEDWRYWMEITTKPAARYPVDWQGGECYLEDMRHWGTALSEMRTEQLLRRVNHAYNTEINDILLAALSLAIQEWSGMEEIWVQMEGHGREELFEDINLTRTVGWFTACYPVKLVVERDKDLRYQIKHIKECLNRIPHRGIGYGLTSSHESAGERATEGPELSFNYLGQFDGGSNETAFEMS